ncbi:MAG: MotA/TolQ/ExbB proton channel family protein [Candidatus Sumerlaeia bacterium]
MRSIFTRRNYFAFMLAAFLALGAFLTQAPAQDEESTGESDDMLEMMGEERTTPSLANEDGLTSPGATEEIIGSVSFMERLKQGGITMIFLLLLSVVALTFTLERIFKLNQNAIYPSGLTAQAKELWSQGKYEELLDLCKKRPSTLSRIIAAFVRHRHCTSMELSMLAGDLAGMDMRSHLQKAYPIAIVATLSPLLGLLGTVIGMIESFEIVAIAGSLGDASLLAGGISKALVTTATGLVIAVPALGAYHFFRSRTNTMTMALEGEVNELMTSWFMDDPAAAETGKEG